MQRQFCFLKLVCFSPWLADRFHNFELMQNRKNKKWPYILIKNFYSYHYGEVSIAGEGLQKLGQCRE
jgi:hypothetical protein